MPQVTIKIRDITVDGESGVNLKVDCDPPLNREEDPTQAQSVGLRVGEYARRLLSQLAGEDQPLVDGHQINCDSFWGTECDCVLNTGQKAN